MKLIHAIAHCEECNWKCSSLNAMLLSGKHHRKYNHRVHVELGYIHIIG